MNEFTCFQWRSGECPPVIRIVMASDLRRAAEQLTIWRGKGEDEAAFYQRAQAAAATLHRRHGFARWVYLDCIYNVPSVETDPSFGDDDRANTLHALRHTLNNESDKAEVRVACAKAMNRIHGLVPADVW